MTIDAIQTKSPNVAAAAGDRGLPADLNLALTSRRPARLSDETYQAALAARLPAVASGRPLQRNASIIVVTHNNLAFTKLCLHSVLSNTDPGYEVLVVDNGSTDDTPEFLRGLAARCPSVRAIYNAGNRGFAAANNQALEVANGEVVVLLNNDTLVPPGWLSRLIAHLEDPRTGAVGPVTNRICNEAQIDAGYETYGQFLGLAADRAVSHAGQTTDIPMLAMFCLAMRRCVQEQIGPIDERFELGLFEDDDYSMRLRCAGLRIACAEDVFVHHFGEASFGGLISHGGYAGLFEANRRRFEEKWGVTWKSHGRRPDPRRDAERAAVRRAVERNTPLGAIVAVISKGDEELLKFKGRQGWHFPRAADGTYAGCYPADGADALRQLERACDQGADYLAVPASAFWWLEHYGELRRRLQESPIEREDESCRIFELNPADCDQEPPVMRKRRIDFA